MHAGVHFVGFGILHFEVSPVAAADERGYLVPTVFVFPVVLAVDEFFKPRGRQGPLGHFAVAALGNVDLADGRHLIERFGWRHNAEPTAVFH